MDCSPTEDPQSDRNSSEDSPKEAVKAQPFESVQELLLKDLIGEFQGVVDNTNSTRQEFFTNANSLLSVFQECLPKLLDSMVEMTQKYELPLEINRQVYDIQMSPFLNRRLRKGPKSAILERQKNIQVPKLPFCEMPRKIFRSAEEIVVITINSDDEPEVPRSKSPEVPVTTHRLEIIPITGSKGPTAPRPEPEVIDCFSSDDEP